MRAGTFCSVIALAAFLSADAASAAQTGTTTEVVFTEYSPLAGNSELARRMLSPFAGAAVAANLARSGQTLGGQAVDLTKEKFVLHVPPREPQQGYGLLVFIPPWDQARVPAGWDSVLDDHGMIFVTAANSGNDANPLGRRAPLAILGEQNVARRYRLDSQRIYVGGFSGGSLVAMRLALDYPDLFRGAILDAGSNPIGDARTPLPPGDLFHEFQESVHLVYVTGDRDASRLGMDLASMHSMRDWCQQGIENQTANFTAHDVISPEALAHALDALASAAPPDPTKLASCRSATEGQLTAQLQQVQSLLSAGQRDAARTALQDIDTRFGGLAAPQSVELEKKLDAMPEGPKQ